MFESIVHFSILGNYLANNAFEEISSLCILEETFNNWKLLSTMMQKIIAVLRMTYNF